MKAYKISPALDLNDGADPRVQRCISDIADLVTDCLLQGSDRFHYTIDWRDPGSDPDVAYWSENIGEPHIIPLTNQEKLRKRVHQSVDPFNLAGSDIRSIATCRMAAFGYEGEVYLCLREDDPTPAANELALVVVETMAGLLGPLRYLDGWLPGNEAPKASGRG